MRAHCVLWGVWLLGLFAASRAEELDVRCRDYCLTALGDCAEYMDFSTYADCHSRCLAANFPEQEQDSMFGDSLECRMHHMRSAYTKGMAEWSCPHGRLDANKLSNDECPGGCPCVNDCGFQGLGLQRSVDCAIGSQNARSDCKDFMFSFLRFLHKNGTQVHVEHEDPFNSLAETVLPNPSECAALRAWTEGGCVCDATRAGWLEVQASHDTAKLIEKLATGMVPSICGFQDLDVYADCPDLKPAAPPIDVGECLSATSAAAVCAFGTKTQSCCAALSLLDSLGCMCDTVFDALVSLDYSLQSLRDNLYDTCIPTPAQYSNTIGCPSPTFTTSGCDDAPWSRTQDSVMLSERLGTLSKYGKLYQKHSERFRYDIAVEDFASIVAENPSIFAHGIGDYVGFDSFMDYMSLSFHDGTAKGAWAQIGGIRYDWKVEGNTIGYRTKADNLWHREFTRTNRFSVEYTFEECSDLLLEIRIQPEEEVIELFAEATTAEPWAPEAFCQIIMDYCVGELQEFSSYDHCVSFQHSLPRTSCPNVAERGLEGNSTACKMKHALMIPTRPQHHCHHAGTGRVADDTGEFVCVQEDCAEPIKPLQVAAPLSSQREVSEDDKARLCALTESSALLVHLSILEDSPCQPPRQVLDDLFETVPTRSTRASLTDLCRPTWEEGEGTAGVSVGAHLECEFLRYNLALELERFRQHCGTPGPDSTLPSTGAVLKLASDFTAFHELVCTAETGNAEQWLCRSCGEAATSSIAEWAFSRQDAAETPSSPSRYCRQTLHYACSNYHDFAPSFCAVCFPDLEQVDIPQEDMASRQAACARALDEYKGASCSEDNSLPSSWEVDAAPHPSPYPGDDPETSTTEHDLESEKVFDYIVVGAGTAGCVVARRLSDEGYSVLVLEEGVDWNKDEELWELSRQRRSVFDVWKTPMVQTLTSMPSDELLGRPVDITAGSTLGGTSSINGGLYSRPAQEEFDDFWPEDWKAADVLPFFKRLENYQSPTDQADNHGFDGPLTVTPGTNQTFVDAWIEAATKAGLDKLTDGASGGNGKSGVYKLMTAFKDGRRQDAYSAYLLPIMPREGLEVRSGARVAKIVLETFDGKKRATGLVYMLHGLARVSVYARREIIISAGWMGSPKVLLLSGIGPREHLEDLEIDVEHELEGVGQQLSGRPLLNMPFAGQIMPIENMPHLFTSREAEAEWAADGTGVFDTNVLSVYGKANSMLHDPRPHANDYLLGFTDRTYVEGGLPLQGMISMCKVCRPFSKGKVELKSPNPVESVNVHFDFFDDERDLDVMLACVKHQVEVHRHYRYQGIDLTGVTKMTDEQLRHFIRATTSFSQHATSSCRMGDGKLDVVDTRLRVHGIDSLRVIDGSVMPEQPCSGPMATTYMLGERGVAMVIEDAVEALDVGSHVVDGQKAARGLAAATIGSLVVLMVALLIVAILRCRVMRAVLAESVDAAGNSPTNSFSPDKARQGMVQAAQADKVENLERVTSGAVLTRFNRSFRRPSLRAAMTNKDLAEHSYLSIYFAHLSCDAQSVSCAGLKKTPSARILHSVSGQIEHGKLSVIMGSSGSGKTTLLHLLAQRAQPMHASGELLYKVRSDERPDEFVGASGASDSVRRFMRRNIAFLGQETDDLRPELTVFETMVYYFTLMVSPQLSTPYAGIREINDTLEFVGLAEQAHKHVWEMSGGQKRRLQLAIRLLDTPLALFLDEPDAGLDATTLLKMIVLLTQITDKYGVTIVATLHRPRQEVLRLAHSIFVMHQGTGIFQGSYENLENCLHRLNRPDYHPGNCAMDYMLDYEAVDANLLREVFRDHVERCNREVIPELRALAAVRDPNQVHLDHGLMRGSLVLCSTTLFSVFVNLVGQRRNWRVSLSDLAAKHACAMTLIGTAVLFLAFADGFLPIRGTQDVAVLHGAFLIWASSTLTVFQVVVAGGMVEPELRGFSLLMQDELLSPLHITVFWLARSMLVCLACLSGFVLFYFGLGFQTMHALDTGLVWFLFVFQTCVGAHLFQVAFGKDLAPVLYGLWSAIQIMFCGLTVPLTRIPDAWDWIHKLNPQYYVFSLQISMEMAVGRHVECGEYCSGLLETFGYENVDLLVTVLVVIGFLVAQVGLIFLALWWEERLMRSAVEISPVDKSAYGQQELKPDDLKDIGHAVGFADVNVRKLLAERMRYRQSVDENARQAAVSPTKPSDGPFPVTAASAPWMQAPPSMYGTKGANSAELVMAGARRSVDLNAGCDLPMVAAMPPQQNFQVFGGMQPMPMPSYGMQQPFFYGNA